MKYFILVKNNIKSLIAIKRMILIIFFSSIFIYFSIELILELNININDTYIYMMNGKLTNTIKGKFLYLLNQFLVISAIGNEFYMFLKYKIQYHIIRVGSIMKFYISLILTIVVVVATYHILIVMLTYLLIKLITNNNLIMSLNINYLSLIINILNSIFYTLLSIMLIILTKNTIFSYLILLFIQLISIFLCTININIAKLLPTTQVMISEYSSNIIYNYLYLILSVVIVSMVTMKLFNKDLFNIINTKEI